MVEPPLPRLNLNILEKMCKFFREEGENFVTRGETSLPSIQKKLSFPGACYTTPVASRDERDKRPSDVIPL